MRPLIICAKCQASHSSHEVSSSGEVSGVSGGKPWALGFQLVNPDRTIESGVRLQRELHLGHQMGGKASGSFGAIFRDPRPWHEKGKLFGRPIKAHPPIKDAGGLGSKLHKAKPIGREPLKWVSTCLKNQLRIEPGHPFMLGNLVVCLVLRMNPKLTSSCVPPCAPEVIRGRRPIRPGVFTPSARWVACFCSAKMIIP